MNLDPALVARIAAFHDQPGNGAGGRLHIVLDDGNLADEHISFCVEEAGKAGDTEAVAIGGALLALGPVERWWACELFWDRLFPGRPTQAESKRRAALRYWRVDAPAGSAVAIDAPFWAADAVEGTEATATEIAEEDVAGLLADLVASGVIPEDERQVTSGVINAVRSLGAERPYQPETY